MANQRSQTKRIGLLMVGHVDPKSQHIAGDYPDLFGAILNPLGIELGHYMHRHHFGDWGDLCDEDKQANENALANGDRIISCYNLPGGQKLLIITEGTRSTTCVMLSEEY